jgi:hypothetical protein
VDALLNGPARVAAGRDGLSPTRLDVDSRSRARLRARNAKAARCGRGRLDAQQHDASAEAAGDWQLDDHTLALAGEQQSCLVPATAGRLMAGGRGRGAGTAS